MFLLLTALRCPSTEHPESLHARFGEKGGRIGRSASCDLPLVDPARVVSREHAEIRFREGAFSLKVISTVNPVRINEALVEPGGAMQLDSGDRILIGDYLFEVRVVEADASPMPAGPNSASPFAEFEKSRSPALTDGFGSLGTLLEGSSAAAASLLDTGAGSSSQAAALPGQPTPEVNEWGPQDIDRILGVAKVPLPATGGVAPIDPGGSDVLFRAHDFDLPFVSQTAATATPENSSGSLNDVFGLLEQEIGSQPSGSAAAFSAEAPTSSSRRPQDKIAASFQPAEEPGLESTAFLATERAARPRTASDLIRIMAEALGLQADDLDASRPEETIRVLGELLKISLDGLYRLLEMRSQLKSELRIEDRTMIVARENNPLKQVGGLQPALKYLVDVRRHGREPRFMAPQQAVEDAVWDVCAHEMAVMAGTRAALAASLRLFAPEAVERRIQRSGALDAVLPALHKSKLWERFLEMHSELEREAEDRFNQLLNQEFARAYSEQSGKLRRQR